MRDERERQRDRETENIDRENIDREKIDRDRQREKERDRERETETEAETETETETGKKEGERDGEGCTVFARLCPSYRADNPLLEYVLTDDLSPLSLCCFLILTSYSTATRARCTRQRP